jgi:Family of unknown function (DUF5924)/Protein of unknown function (DUF2914)
MRRHWIGRVLPWISLVLGIGSAVWMDRRPERAPLVALAAAAGWLLLALLAVLESARRKALVHRAARLGAAMGSQSLVQLCLFFSAPFFFRAAAIPAHWVFVALLLAAGAVTLWTPLSEAALRHSVAGAALQGLATFAGLDCVLPLLGLSNQLSLLAATIWTALGLPLVALARGGRRGPPLLVALALLIAYLAGAARFVPPAPLRFVEGEMGTRVNERRVVDAAASFAKPPEQLVCFTAIAAPRGLRDRLRHVWRQNGVLRGEVPLEIRGGRPQGFRTWSTHRGITPGRWSCSIETQSGQLLGRLVVYVQ